MSKYKFQKEAVCPWCDHKEDCTYKYFSSYDGDGSSRKVDCNNCGKEFEITKHIDVEYSTSIKCPGHELDINKSELFLMTRERLINKDSLCLYCNVCKEFFHTWDLPGGKYQKIKEGTYKFIGKAVEIMELRGKL